MAFHLAVAPGQNDSGVDRLRIAEQAITKTLDFRQTGFCCLIKPGLQDVPLSCLRFLTDIEKGRGNTARTRNARLAAIKSFFRYLEYREPSISSRAGKSTAFH